MSSLPISLQIVFRYLRFYNTAFRPHYFIYYFYQAAQGEGVLWEAYRVPLAFLTKVVYAGKRECGCCVSLIGQLIIAAFWLAVWGGWPVILVLYTASGAWLLFLLLAGPLTIFLWIMGWSVITDNWK